MYFFITKIKREYFTKYVIIYVNEMYTAFFYKKLGTLNTFYTKIINTITQAILHYMIMQNQHRRMPKGEPILCSSRLYQVNFDCRDNRKDDNHEQYNPNQIRVHLIYLQLFCGKFGRNMLIKIRPP